MRLSALQQLMPSIALSKVSTENKCRKLSEMMPVLAVIPFSKSNFTKSNKVILNSGVYK
jgi:hypothetical protein